jgi:hypothetical protein
MMEFHFDFEEIPTKIPTKTAHIARANLLRNGVLSGVIRQD